MDVFLAAGIMMVITADNNCYNVTICTTEFMK